MKYWKEALILFGLAVGLYAMSVPYEFVLDDQIVITDNAFTKKGLDGIKEIMLAESFTGYFGEQKDLVAGSRYRPLSIAMFAVEYHFAGPDPRVFHIVSVLLYGLLVLLIFRVLSILTAQVRKPDMWFLSVPFIAGLLFALHPVHTEVVANIKGRDEILSMIGAMGAMYASLRYVYKGSFVWLILSAISLFVGLLAKENAITFLAVIPAAFYFFTKENRKQWLIASVPLVLAAVAYIAWRVHVIGYLFSENVSTDLMNDPFVEMNLSQKYATITYTLGLYIKLLIFPHPLTHDYYPYQVPIMEWVKPGVIVSALLYVGLMVGAVTGMLRKKMYGFCIIFYLATISIVSNVFFPIGTFMNERFLFMPSLAFCLAAAYYAMHYRQKFDKLRWAIPIALVILIAGYIVKSVTRIPAWENPVSLNAAGVAVSTNSCRANCFMGTALYKAGQDISDREERYQYMLDAEKYVDRSLEIYPTYYSANQMKAGFVAEQYRYDRDLPKLLSAFETILISKPNVPYIPRYCEYLNGRGNIDQRALLDFYYRVGVDIMVGYHQRTDYATKYINYALSVSPNDARSNYAAGLIQQAAGNQQRATEYLNKAYSLDPSLRSN